MSIRFRFSIWMGLFILICASLVWSLTRHTWEDLERASRYQVRVRTADLLDEAANWHAIERGSGRSVLDGGEGLLAVHMNARVQADRAVAEARELLAELDRSVGGMALTEPYELWSRHLEKLSAAREQFDAEDMSVGEWLQVTTDMIEGGEMPLRIAVFRPVTDSDMVEYLNADLLPHLAQMAELAGLERQMIAGVLASKKVLSAEDLNELNTLHTRFGDSAQHIATARELPSLPEHLRRSIDAYEEQFYGGYQDHLKEVLAASQKAADENGGISNRLRRAQSSIAVLVANFEEDLVGLCEAEVLVARAEDFIEGDPELHTDALRLLENYLVVHRRHYTRASVVGIDGSVLVQAGAGDHGAQRSQAIEPHGISDTSCVSAALELGEGEVHFSSIELRREGAGIVRPFEPVLQLSSPIYSDGAVAGAVLLEFNAQRLLDLVPEAVRAVDQDGYYLRHEDPNKTWGMMEELGRVEQRLVPRECSTVMGNVLVCEQSGTDGSGCDSIDIAGPEGGVYIGLYSSLSEVAYPMGPDVWMAYSTGAIDSLVTIRRGLSAFATEISERTMSQARKALLWSVFQLLAAVVVVIVLYRFVRRRILAPLSQVVDVMEQLGRGEDGIRLGIEQSDEVGRMSTAIDQFAANYEQARFDLGRQMTELIEARTRAEDANRLKGEFLSTITHEIRTPMNGILGTSQLLLETDLESGQMELLEIIEHSSLALSGIINDILDFSEVESGEVQITPRPFDLRGCVGAVADSFNAQVSTGAVELVIDFDPRADGFVIGDSKRVRDVLTQLVSNALKFTSVGHVMISVRCLPQGDGPEVVELEVSDSGVGIEASAIPSLFDLFTQADGSTTREFGGTGLGLAIVKQLVERMGGEISVVSSVGKGATFCCVLPLSKVAPSGQELGSTLLVGHEILIVDDLPEARNALARTVRALGATVTLAADELDVQREICGSRERGFDAVFIDAEVATRHSGRLLMAIASAQTGSSSRVVGLLRAGVEPVPGVDQWLSKPVSLRSLKLVLAGLSGPLVNCEPVAALPGEPTAQVAEVHPAPVANLDPTRALVLLVDDNAINRRVAGMLLTRSGCDFICAENGLEAIELAGKETFDLILMDLQMPVLGGVDAARGIRALSPPFSQVPIIALTANDTPQDREDCQAAGMDGFLAKPLTLSALKDALSAHLVMGHRGTGC